MFCAEHKVLQCKSHTHKNNGREFKASYKNNFKTHYNCSFLEIKQTKGGGRKHLVIGFQKSLSQENQGKLQIWL